MWRDLGVAARGQARAGRAAEGAPCQSVAGSDACRVASRIQQRLGAREPRLVSVGAQAQEGVKRLEPPPRGTLRPLVPRGKPGHGMVGEPMWEQESPVSAPRCETGREPTGAVAWEQTSPLRREPAKRGSAEREAERPRVLEMPRTTAPRRREGAVLGRCAGRRNALVHADAANDPSANDPIHERPHRRTTPSTLRDDSSGHGSGRRRRVLSGGSTRWMTRCTARTSWRERGRRDGRTVGPLGVRGHQHGRRAARGRRCR